jgi:hypothetical protein
MIEMARCRGVDFSQYRFTRAAKFVKGAFDQPKKHWLYLPASAPSTLNFNVAFLSTAEATLESVTDASSSDAEIHANESPRT